MTAMSHTNLLQSLDYALNMLMQLGVVLPSSYSRNDALNEIHQTQTMLNAISDETILDYHISTDHTKIMAMKLLAKMTNCLIQCKPFLAPLVTVKLVRLTIEHGLVSKLFDIPISLDLSLISSFISHLYQLLDSLSLEA